MLLQSGEASSSDWYAPGVRDRILGPLYSRFELSCWLRTLHRQCSMKSQKSRWIDVPQLTPSQLGPIDWRGSSDVAVELAALKLGIVTSLGKSGHS